MPTKLCANEICRQSFEPTKGCETRQKYCSRRCKLQTQTRRQDERRRRQPLAAQPCAYCNNDFQPRKIGHIFCSRVCQYNAKQAALAAQRAAGMAARPCKVCRQTFKPIRRSHRICGKVCRMKDWTARKAARRAAKRVTTCQRCRQTIRYTGRRAPRHCPTVCRPKYKWMQKLLKRGPLPAGLRVFYWHEAGSRPIKIQGKIAKALDLKQVVLSVAGSNHPVNVERLFIV